MTLLSWGEIFKPTRESGLMVNLSELFSFGRQNRSDGCFSY